MDNKFLFIQHYEHSLGPAERKQVELWLSENKKNREEYKDIIRIWEKSKQAGLLRHADIEKEWNIILHKHTAKARPVKRFANLYKIAASVAIAIGISWLLYWQVYKFPYAEIANNTINTIETVTLADGSTISLNYNAKIKYPKKFKNKSRDVSLSGEAYFSVKRDTLAPFTIKTSNGTVQVLGTTFNVKSLRGLTSVAVESGKVKLADRQNNFVILEKGYEGRVTPSDLSKNINTNKNYLAWKDGKFIFQDAVLGQVFKDLKSRYHVDYEFTDPLLQERKLTANFDNESIEDTLTIIQMSCQVEIEKKSNVILITNE